MSISKAFRVLTLVLAAVFVPATAFAGTTGAAPTQAKAGKFTAAARPALKGAKLRAGKGNKANKVRKADKKASKKAHKAPKIRIARKAR